MKDKIISLIKKYIPELIIEFFEIILQLPEYKLKYKIKKYYLSLNKNEQDFDIIQIINFLKTHRFSIFPYDFIDNYKTKRAKVYFDKLCNMNFILHNDKRLYFPSNLNKIDAESYYISLCKEQDVNSPHRYQTQEYTVRKNDIILDAGAAEGIWALDNIENAKKVYLFECNDNWIKALEKTFEPWKDKIIIVNKYISNKNDSDHITIDNFFLNEEINFIKADIEGFEIDLLEGAERVLTTNKNIKLLLCTYHKHNDAENIIKLLEDNDFSIEFSNGYMFPIMDNNLKEPYRRRGLIRAKKI